MKNFILSHVDFKIYNVTWITIAVALLLYPAVLFLPQSFGYENGIIEDIQLLVLLSIFIICMKSKINKKFFNFCALIIVVLMIREVNCGRTIFFPIEGEYHKYYSWRNLPYKWLGKVVHGLYGALLAFCALLFFKKEIYKDTWEAIKNIRFPFWNCLFVMVSVCMGAVAEKLTNNNFVFEEGFELLFYVSLMGIAWLYSRNENFILKKSEEE